MFEPRDPCYFQPDWPDYILDWKYHLLQIVQWLVEPTGSRQALFVSYVKSFLLRLRALSLLDSMNLKLCVQ